MRKRFFISASIVLLFLGVYQLLDASTLPAFARPRPPQRVTIVPGMNRLEDDLSQWNVYHDQGYTEGTLQSIPMQGKNTLKVSLLHGNQNYADIHAYRNLPAIDTATNFSMDVSFLYQDEKAIQALEFTMNKWVNNVRWEWALQWQVVPDGSSTQGLPRTWRVWNGSTWQNLQVQQNLGANKRHTLHLYGNIVNNLVHYAGFSCDGVSTDMSQLTFSSVASSGDKLAVGLQLDGNYREMAYSVFYKDVNLHYQ